VTSSMPMDMPEKQAALFRELLSALEEKAIPYAVSGAFALRQHRGICRFSKDLDVRSPQLGPQESSIRADRRQPFLYG